MTIALIALDWGTSSLRAYAIAADGSMLGERAEALGIMQVSNGDFAGALRRCCGDWIDAHPDAALIASGMIGSKQGWKEAPYCACPADATAIAGAIVTIDLPGGRKLHIVPGVSHTDAESGVPDVMRGEETQIIGALPATGTHLAVLPGTHSKWVWIEHGAIVRFSSWMTGEVYAALTQHTILGRLMQVAAPHDDSAFTRGVQYGFGNPGALLNRMFSARTLGLFEHLPAPALPSYLSGLLIGAEIGGALATTPAGERQGLPVTVLGSQELTARYTKALTLCAYQATGGAANAACRGLVALARKIP